MWYVEGNKKLEIGGSSNERQLNGFLKKRKINYPKHKVEWIA